MLPVAFNTESFKLLIELRPQVLIGIVMEGYTLSCSTAIAFIRVVLKVPMPSREPMGRFPEFTKIPEAESLQIAFDVSEFMWR